MIALYLLSALVMFLLEYFVLLRVYRRPKNIQTISLVVAPLMIVLAIFLTFWIQKLIGLQNSYIQPLILFIVLVLLELPLSLYGYPLQPDASIPERLIVAGTFGTASVLIASALINFQPLNF